MAVAGVLRGSRGEGGLRGEITQIRVWGLAGRAGQFGPGRGRNGERAGAGVLVLGAAEELVFPVRCNTCDHIFDAWCLSRPPYLALHAKLRP